MTATRKSAGKAPRMTPAQWGALRYIAAYPRTTADLMAPLTLKILVERGYLIVDRGVPGGLGDRYSLSAKGVEVCAQ